MTSATEVSVAGLDVSRETLAALQQYEDLVRRWTPAINLVSKATLPDLWDRHIVDSAQIFALCPFSATSWADLGSGGGFPGVVIAILAKQLKPDLRVTLVESDLRKATFLRQAAQTLALPVTVRSSRIEVLDPLNAEVISARALAPLADLLAYADRHLAAGGVAVFPKGARYAEELAEAQKTWAFDVDAQQSLSDADAAILVIRNIHRHD
ncbi:16S rRNA (guanine(527)-N(7))-methyltransferase RsmG [Tabrizicola sp.]|uniref:16S rRNA (guanine(527)-N(7))-methyltransferase RsmG n=1 Tax=Tabrizicola sp. TaxID=2005166 RepID=UPI001A5FF084|nr:16S rRNA (guanine(527)-N(7))-methyltransferase RsmG [Tabrizicola sp.]MBL9072818.1 16S rRNA (guanine(527)-N(7))-methyltransferase RsmG [Tabrizicola sp.]